MRLVAFAIYLGIGAMLHAVFNGATFDWTSAWTFGWLFGWPIMLFIVGGGFILALLVVLVGTAIIWSWLDTLSPYWAKLKARIR
jgi:biotin transporter BioY